MYNNNVIRITSGSSYLILCGGIEKVTFRMFNKIMYHVALVSFFYYYCIVCIVLKSCCNSYTMARFTVQNSIVGP